MPANRTLALLRALSVTSALGFTVVPRLAVAQTAPATETTTTTVTAAPAAPESEEPMVLSPFVVDASEDKGSYKANSTLAGTRVRTDLKDVSSAITVVTAQFLQDTGAKNQEDLLVYTPSTEVTGLRGNFSGVAGTANPSENTVSSTTRVRGLDAADNTRDYFLTDIPWDSFDVGRVDQHTVHSDRAAPLGLGLPIGGDVGFGAGDLVGGRCIDTGGDRNLVGMYRPFARVAQQRGAPGVTLVSGHIPVVGVGSVDRVDSGDARRDDHLVPRVSPEFARVFAERDEVGVHPCAL